MIKSEKSKAHFSITLVTGIYGTKDLLVSSSVGTTIMTAM